MGGRTSDAGFLGTEGLVTAKWLASPDAARARRYFISNPRAAKKTSGSNRLELGGGGLREVGPYVRQINFTAPGWAARERSVGTDANT